MKAAVLHSSPGRLEIEDLATDKPTSREVLVRTAHAGLCHSDLHFMDGAWQVGAAVRTPELPEPQPVEPPVTPAVIR